MARLLVLEGDGRGNVYDVQTDVTLGRDKEATIVLRGRGISRVHARIRLKGSRFFLKDFGSKNGTLLNGVRVGEHLLQAGDRIGIGSVTLVFEPDFEIQVGEKGGLILTRGESSDKPEVTADAADAAELVLPPEKGGIPAVTDHMRLHALYEIARLTASTLEESVFLSRLAERARVLLHGQRAAILLCDADGENIRPGAVSVEEGESDEISVSRTLLKYVLGKRQGIAATDAASDPRFAASMSLRMGPIRSILCAPLIRSDALLGAIYVDSRDLDRAYTPEDLDLLVAMAQQSGMALGNARAFARTRQEVSRLRRHVGEQLAIVGESAPIRAVLEKIRKVAGTAATVLITGETGTGKELAAKAIHHESPRRNGPFVPVDCTAISEHLLESELFGHEKGAFTGADRTKPGKFEVAHGGTLFLDEIGDIDPTTQIKLLRVLEERAFTRVGGLQLIKVDVRIIAATNKNLEKAVEEGKFREDLYYRLAVVPIHQPPLRERRTDIVTLAEHFFRKFVQETDRPLKGFTPEAQRALIEYPWPGNVRELRNSIERAVVLAEGEWIGPDLVTARWTSPEATAQASADLLDTGMPLSDIIGEVERRCIQRALERANGKKIEAARLLGISRPTLDKKLKEFGLEKEEA